MNRIVVTGAALAGLAAGLVLFTLTRPDGSRGGSSAVTEPARTPEAAPASVAARAPDRAGSPPSSRERLTPSAVPRVPEPGPARVEKPPRLGTLRIDSDVPGAQVFIDRRFIGTAPVTAENVPPGTHQLNVSAPGFDGVAETIDVEAGLRDLTISLRAVRLNTVIAVVHDHRLGSCAGQLVATPEGLRFEAADLKDAFTAALADLDRFEVDYLAGKLRVRLRGGREYTFTDPEDNADRLFVFHRDVERAREQLAKRRPG